MGGADRTIDGGERVALPAPPRRARLRAALGYALAAACLVWVLHDYDFRDLVRRVAGMNLWLVAAAICCDVLSYVCQGARWWLLLRPFDSISVWRCTQAVYAGLFTNEVAPMKPGDLVRAYLVSRWMSVKLVTVAATILVERLFDGVWLAVGSLLVVIFLPLPRKLVEAGDVFGVAVLILLVLFIITAFGSGGTEGKLAAAGGGGIGRAGQDTAVSEVPEGESAGRRVSRRVSALLARLRVELRCIGRTREAPLAFAFTLALLLLQALSFWLVMRAYGLRLPLMAGAAVFLIVHLGTVVPGAPANVGTYQFFTVLGLTLFGVDKTAAAGFSLVVFALLTVPLWAIGFWALGRSGVTLTDVRDEFLKNRFAASRQ